MESIRWQENGLYLLDQRKLPHSVEYIFCKDHITVAKAIKELSVRGAPAIGVAAAYGLVLGLYNTNCRSIEELYDAAEEISASLFDTRPTAVNLKWALERMKKVLYSYEFSLDNGVETCYNNSNTKTENHLDVPLSALIDALLREAHLIMYEDIQTNKLIGSNGAELVPDGAGILNHCNAGSLATAGYGTSLGVIRSAVATGKKVTAYINETRPLLQGARLTAWEMMQEGIPSYLITDNMAAALMATGKVNLVIVGADRIAANGDVANKIGTYGLAVLAKEHNLPFYVAAPLSTVDFETANGSSIPIEERDSREITHINDYQVAPEGVKVWNPAFDVTPASYISAIITEKGIVRPPYVESLISIAVLE